MAGVTVVLPIKTVSEANGRGHWGAKAKRTAKQRRDAWIAMPAHSLPCIVTLTRIAPRELDTDNLTSSMKAVRDGIADRLGVDDRNPIVQWRYAQERGRVREYAVRVHIERLRV